jgi:hypothetical protein
MRVLLMDSHPGVASPAETALHDAGHEIVRCRDPRTPTDPCTAWTEGCPLDGEHVDVAVDVRAVTGGIATPGEQGVVCASRAGVPVLLAGEVALHPFRPFSPEEHEGEEGVPAAAAAAVKHAITREEARIAEAASLAAGHDVEVERQGDELVLVVRATEAAAGAAAVRAHAGARLADPSARRIRVRTELPG